MAGSFSTACQQIEAKRGPVTPVIMTSAAARRLRLLFLLEELHFGGTQRQTLELARRLPPQQFSSTICLLRQGAGLAPLAQRWRLPVQWLAATDGVGLRSLANLYRRLRQGDIDVLILLTAIPNIWGRLLGRLARVPCIIGNVRSQTAHRQHERWLWPLAHHLICNNQALWKTLVSGYRIPHHRLSLVYNGVDTEFFRPGPNPASPMPPVVLSVGRLVADKDHQTLIRAFRLVLNEHPTAALWLVGDGPRQPYLLDLLRRELPAGRARWFPPHVDLRPFYHRAACFALSSVTEALPNVVLEAMASGLPVVATDVGGVPEAVIPGQTGWLVPPRDPAALGSAISQILTDDALRSRFGHAGRELAVRNFSLTRMVQAFAAILQQVVGSKEGNPVGG